MAMEHSSNSQTENSDTTRFYVSNHTADKIRICDLPSLINLNARSLNSEKVDKLHVTVATHDVSIVCVNGTWFKDYNDTNNNNIFYLVVMDSNSLTM